MVWMGFEPTPQETLDWRCRWIHRAMAAQLPTNEMSRTFTRTTQLITKSLAISLRPAQVKSWLWQRKVTILGPFVRTRTLVKFWQAFSFSFLFFFFFFLLSSEIKLCSRIFNFLSETFSSSFVHWKRFAFDDQRLLHLLLLLSCDEKTSKRG